MPAKQPITADDLYRLVQAQDPQLSPDGRHLVFVRETMDRLDNAYQQHLWLIRLEDRQPQARQTLLRPPKLRHGTSPASGASGVNTAPS